MSEQSSPTQSLDLTQGIALDKLADGEMLLGHVGETSILLVRRAGDIFAIGATCTHYGGPLVDGLVVGDTIRCPLHHACFSLRTGAALRPPALNALSRWRVEQRDGMASYADRSQPEPPTLAASICRPLSSSRRRRLGKHRRGDLATGGLFRRHHDLERRLVVAVRSAQPVKRVSRRNRAGTMDTVRPAEFYASSASICSWQRA